jgi:hypothetical protein
MFESHDAFTPQSYAPRSVRLGLRTRRLRSRSNELRQHGRHGQRSDSERFRNWRLAHGNDQPVEYRLGHEHTAHERRGRCGLRWQLEHFWGRAGLCKCGLCKCGLCKRRSGGSTSGGTGGGGRCVGVATCAAGSYAAGAQVQNGINLYQCKPYPYTGWCGGEAAAYAPGSGFAWTDAWTLVGPC